MSTITTQRIQALVGWSTSALRAIVGTWVILSIGSPCWSDGSRARTLNYLVEPATQGRPAPILYYCLDDYTPLTADELNGIFGELSPPWTESRRMWFLRAHMRKPLRLGRSIFPDAGPDPLLTVFITAFFEPDTCGGRVRRGVMTSLVFSRYEGGRFELRSRGSHQYAQVSRKGMQHEDLAVPLPSDLPFTAPAQLSDAQLIALHDCARDGARYYGHDAHADKSELSLQLESPDRVKVYLGHGGGIIVLCQQVDQVYVPYMSPMEAWVE